MQKDNPESQDNPRRWLEKLPGVSRMLETPELEATLREYGPALITDLLREGLERLRGDIVAGRLSGPAFEAAVTPLAISEAVQEQAEGILSARPRQVINATGVVVHTNLGRAILSERAAAAVAEAAGTYQDLEYDLDEGRRGNRLSNLEPLMQRLFPGRGFTVVNNNAAAVMLCLRALSRDREAVVSRGELVEIGGSFRVPDIMAASGAILREVGTTNRTRVTDYERALTPRTGMLLKVHTSNFRIVGFTEETSVRDLARLSLKSKVPLVVDWGSGDLVDLSPLEIRDEQPVIRILDEGADLVTFSGDKLLGGPQAGFVVGRSDLVDQVRRDPLARVCRLDRLRFGALHQTLAAYVRGSAFEDVPTLRMLAATSEEIEARAVRLREEVQRRTGKDGGMEIIDGVSRTGGGSSPTGERPTRLLAVSGPTGDAGKLESRLRSGNPPVIGRVQEGRLLLDLRTVLPGQESTLAERLVEALLADD